MKPIDKLLGSALKLKRTSLALTNSFGRNSVVNNRDQRKILEQRKKNQQERLKTFRSFIGTLKQKEQDSGNKTNALLGGLGLSALAGGALGRMRGAKPMIPGGKPRSVRVPTGGLRRPGVLPKGKVSGIGGPLNFAFAGIDFAMRKGSGQNNLQAGAGAGAGLLGGLGGMKAGAVAGGAIGAMFGGVGAIPGAAIGGLLGGFLGSNLASGVADSITGADARRIEETRRSGMLLAKTPFGTGLDSFEKALGKLEKLNTLCYVESEPVEPVEPKDRKGGNPGPQNTDSNPNPNPNPSPEPNLNKQANQDNFDSAGNEINIGDEVGGPDMQPAAISPPEPPPLEGVTSFTGKTIPKELYGLLTELQKEYLETAKTASRMTDLGFLKVGATAPNRAGFMGGPDMSPRISFNPELTPESNERAVSQMEAAGTFFNLPSILAPFASVLGGKGAFGQRKPNIPKLLKQPIKIGTPAKTSSSTVKDQKNMLERIFNNQSATPAAPGKELVKLGGGKKVSMILPVEEGQNQPPLMGGGGSGGGVRVISGPSDAKVARYIIDALSQTTA